MKKYTSPKLRQADDKPTAFPLIAPLAVMSAATTAAAAVGTAVGAVAANKMLKVDPCESKSQALDAVID